MRRARHRPLLAAAALALAACSLGPDDDVCQGLVGDLQVVVDSAYQQGFFVSPGDSVRVTATVREVVSARKSFATTVTVCEATFGAALPQYTPAFASSEPAVVAVRPTGWVVGVQPGQALVEVSAGPGVEPVVFPVQVSP